MGFCTASGAFEYWRNLNSVKSVEFDGKKRSAFLDDSGGGEASKRENDVKDVIDDDNDVDDKDVIEGEVGKVL